MKVPEGIKKCVAFVALRMANGTFRLCGTVFFVNRDNSEKKLSYAVTAKHVIEGIKSKGLEEVYFRLNQTDNSLLWVKSNISDWIYHDDPNVDVAIHPMWFQKSYDHIVFPMSRALDEEIIDKNEIDVGDEVFITGLFRHHHGTSKNIPITRIGNISAMPDEKIQTKFHLMDAYLIEARSIGGLSGSPVFVNLGVVRFIEGKVQNANSGIMFFLAGLIYGHYDVKSDQIDEINEDSDSSDRVNTGIAIVTPIEKLEEVFKQKNVIDYEAKVKTS